MVDRGIECRRTFWRRTCKEERDVELWKMEEE